jgi:glycerate 2-kinase
MRSWRDEARDHARTILTRILQEANPQHVFRARLAFDERRVLRVDGARVADLAAARRVRVAAVGKAAGGMAAHAQPWGPFAEAVVVAPHAVDIPGFASVVGTHPEPGEGSVEAGERLMRLARDTMPEDLLLVLLSGGASALAELPAVPLADLQRATQLLLASGADIHEVNCVRKHLSLLKGGRLLQAARGRVVVLAISDVEGDDLAAIGSGIAAPDPTTYDDALDVLRRHDLADAVPRSVRERLHEGAKGLHAETLKPGDAALERLSAHVLASNADVLRAGARAAAELGYDTHVVHEGLQGLARETGRRVAQTARDLAHGSPSASRPTCLLYGGETVVRIQGAGLGGRNMETALAAVDGLSGLDAVLACVGTDGRDGPTDAAGAIVDGMTRARAEAHGLVAEDYLQENDSYHYFEALDDLVKTGPTGTNVRDVAVLLVRARAPTGSP